MMKDTMIQRKVAEAGLLDGPRLLEHLFPNPVVRPSLRWLTDQREKGRLPHYRIGRLIFFDPTQVRLAIQRMAVPTTPKRTT